MSMVLKIVLVGVAYVAVLWAADSAILKESVSYLFSKKGRRGHEER